MTKHRENPYSDQPPMEEALAFVYMAQHVRWDEPSRAGVLVQDCRAYHRELQELESNGDVTRLSWVKLEGFGTTSQGQATAHQIVQGRLDSSGQRLSHELDRMPKRLAQYLLTNLTLADMQYVSDAGRFVRIEQSITDSQNVTGSSGMLGAWCLLRNPEILESRDRLFDVLESMQLAVRVRSYVSTNGGELREQLYVMAPELETFSREYLRTSGLLSGRLWPRDLEDRHSVFHLLGRALGSDQLSRDVVDREIPVRLRQEVRDFVKGCMSEGLLDEVKSNAGAYYRSKGNIAYRERLEDRFWKPLVDFLLQRQPSTCSPDAGQGLQDHSQAQEGTLPNAAQTPPGNNILDGDLASSSRDRLLDCFTGEYSVKPPDQAWLSDLGSTLQSILDELGIPCVVTTKEFQSGPRVVRANVRLSKGIRIKKITGAASDIANKLFSRGELFRFASDDEVPKSVRVESVPAKGTVGIYIPRNDFVAVPIGDILRSLPNDSPLSFPVGLNTIGELQFSNLDSMPHLLVAGQTGAGKSVFLNCMIVSLALQNDPARLQFVLIDPKGGLEFGPYERLPHVPQGQMVASAELTVNALSSAREEMDNRYSLMRDAAKDGHPSKKIQEYNNIPGIKPLPYCVIIVDEFADLVLSKYSSQVVELVQALAQKGRAAGFYMVICTQRPSVKVIPGDIKAVVSSRISFRLPTGGDSRVILDEPGAEDLLGKGDMFLKETTHPELRRFQGPFVTNEEIDRFVNVAVEVWGSAASSQ